MCNYFCLGNFNTLKKYTHLILSHELRRSPRRNRHITTTPSFTGHIANSTLTTQRNTNSNSSALYLAIAKDQNILQLLDEIFKCSVRLPSCLKTNQNNSSACNIYIFFCLFTGLHTYKAFATTVDARVTLFSFNIFIQKALQSSPFLLLPDISSL